MQSMKRLWIGLAMAPVLVAVLGVAPVARAAEKQIKCEMTKDGKTETHQAASAEDCAKMGGKVVSGTKHKTRHKKKY